MFSTRYRVIAPCVPRPRSLCCPVDGWLFRRMRTCGVQHSTSPASGQKPSACRSTTRSTGMDSRRSSKGGPCGPWECTSSHSMTASWVYPSSPTQEGGALIASEAWACGIRGGMVGAKGCRWSALGAHKGMRCGAGGVRCAAVPLLNSFSASPCLSCTPAQPYHASGAPRLHLYAPPPPLLHCYHHPSCTALAPRHLGEFSVDLHDQPLNFAVFQLVGGKRSVLPDFGTHLEVSGCTKNRNCFLYRGRLGCFWTFRLCQHPAKLPNTISAPAFHHVHIGTNVAPPLLAGGM